MLVLLQMLIANASVAKTKENLDSHMAEAHRILAAEIEKPMFSTQKAITDLRNRIEYSCSDATEQNIRAIRTLLPLLDKIKPGAEPEDEDEPITNNYSKIISLLPTTAPAESKRPQIYRVAENKRPQAKRVAENKHPQAKRVAESKGPANQLSVSIREQIAALQEREKSASDLGLILNEIGRGYLQLREFENALEYFNRLRSLYPESAEPHANCAFALDSLKRPKETIEACNTALKLNPNIYVAYRIRARAYQRLQQPEAAAIDAFQCLIIKPDEPPDQFELITKKTVTAYVEENIAYKITLLTLLCESLKEVGVFCAKAEKMPIELGKIMNKQATEPLIVLSKIIVSYLTAPMIVDTVASPASPGLR